jgi:hypothetical protein
MCGCPILVFVKIDVQHGSELDLDTIAPCTKAIPVGASDCAPRGLQSGRTVWASRWMLSRRRMPTGGTHVAIGAGMAEASSRPGAAQCPIVYGATELRVVIRSDELMRDTISIHREAPHWNRAVRIVAYP